MVFRRSSGSMNQVWEAAMRTWLRRLADTLAGYARRRPRLLFFARRHNASQSGLRSPCYRVVLTSAGGKLAPLHSRP
jgi:hypothetical protein